MCLDRYSEEQRKDISHRINVRLAYKLRRGEISKEEYAVRVHILHKVMRTTQQPMSLRETV